ncbi:UNVERIFIED_CONTAM: hypothetical protein HDU68_011264 [Siphonaria sp. JEL0065]|nr:hypothetical protein HDU68_011264 [Siphonaria sp. JEL0065]
MAPPTRQPPPALDAVGMQTRLDQTLADLELAHAHLSDLRTEPFSAFSVNAQLQKAIGSLRVEADGLKAANAALAKSLELETDAKVAAMHDARLAVKQLESTMFAKNALAAENAQLQKQAALLNFETTQFQMDLAKKDAQIKSLTKALDALSQKSSDSDWCSNCSNLMRLNEDDHAQNIAQIALLKKDVLAANATVALLEAKVSTTELYLKDEQDAHFNTAHKLALCEASVARLELENKQSQQNMKSYMKYSEDQQHLLISQIERMQSFSNRRLDGATAVVSKTNQQFLSTLNAMKELSALVWLSSPSAADSTAVAASNLSSSLSSSPKRTTASPSKDSPHSTPTPLQTLMSLESKLDKISESMSCIFSTLKSNASSTNSSENSTHPIVQLVKRNNLPLPTSSNSILFFGGGSSSSMDNISSPSNLLLGGDTPVGSLMKRIGSTLGLTHDSNGEYISLLHSHGSVNSATTAAAGALSSAIPSSAPSPSRRRRRGLESTDSDLVMESLSDLEGSEEEDDDDENAADQLEEDDLGTITNPFLRSDSNLNSILWSIRRAKLSKLVKIVSDRENEIVGLNAEVERLKRVLQEVAVNVENAPPVVSAATVDGSAVADAQSSEGGQSKNLPINDEFAVNLEWKNRMLTFEKKELASKFEVLSTRVSTLQQAGLKLKSELDSKSMDLERSDMTLQETVSQLHQTQMKLEEVESLYTSILEENNQIRSESDVLKKRMAAILKKIEGKTLEIVSIQLNSESTSPQPHHQQLHPQQSSPRSPFVQQQQQSTSPSSLLSPTATTPSEIQSATRYLAEKEAESKHLRSHIEKLNLRVTESFHKIRDLESRLFASVGEVERLKGVEDMCGQLEVECEKWRSVAATVKQVSHLQPQQHPHYKREEQEQGESDARSMNELKAALVRMTLESEHLIEGLNRDKKRVQDELEKREKEMERMRKKLCVLERVVEEKDDELAKVASASAVSNAKPKNLEKEGSPIRSGGGGGGGYSKDNLVRLLEQEKNAAVVELERARGELGASQDKVITLQATITVLEGKVSSREAQYSALEMQNLALSADVKLSSASCAKLTKEVEGLTNHIAILQEQQQTETDSKTIKFTEKLSAFQSNIEVLEHTCHTQDVELKRMMDLVTSTQNEKTALSKELESRMMELGALHSKTLGLQACINALEKSVSERDRKLSMLEDQSATLLAEKHASLEELSDKSTQLSTIQNQLETHEYLVFEKSAKLEDVLKHVYSLEKLLQGKQEELKGLASSMELLKEEKTALSELLDTALGEKMALSREVSDKSARLLASQREISAHQQLVEEKSLKLNDVMNQVSTLQKTLQKKEQGLKIAESMVEQLKVDKESLAASLEEAKHATVLELSKKSSRLSAIQQQLKTHEQLVLEKTTKLDDLQKQVSALQKTLQEKEQRLKTAESLLEQLKADKETLAESMDADKRLSVEEISKKSFRLAEVQQQLKTHEQLAFEKSAKVEDLVNQVSTLQKVLQEKDHKLRFIESSMEKLKEEKGSLAALLDVEMTEKRASLEELLDKSKKLDEMRKELSTQQQLLSEKTLKLNELSKQVLHHQNASKALEKSLKEKDDKLQCFNSSLGQLKEEKEALEAFLNSEVAGKRESVEELSRSSETLLATRNELSTHQQMVTEKSREIEILFEQVSLHQATIRTLKTSLNERDYRIQDIESSLEKLQEEKGSLEALLDAEMTERYAMEKKSKSVSKSLDDVLVSKNVDLDRLYRQIQSLTNERDVLSKELLKRTSELESLNDELEATQKAFTGKEAKCVEAAKQLSIKQATLRALEEVVTANELKLVQFEERFNNVMSENKSLTSKLDSNWSDVQALQVEIAACRSVIKSLETTLAQKDDISRVTEQKMANLAQENEFISIELSAMSTKADSLHKELNSVQTDLSHATSKCAEYADQLAVCQTTIKSFEQKLSLAERSLFAAQERIKSLDVEKNSALESLSSKSQGVNLLLQELETLKIALQDKTQEWVSLSHRESLLQNEVAMLQQNLTAGDANSKSLRDALANLSAGNKALAFELEKVAAENSTLSTKVPEFQHTIMALQDNITEKEAHVRGLESRVSSISSKAKTLGEDLSSKIQQVETLEYELSSVRKAISSSNNSKDSQLSEQSSKISDLEKTIYEKDVKLQSVENNLAICLVEKDSLVSALDSLRQEYSSSVTRLKEMGIEETIIREQILSLKTTLVEKDSVIQSLHKITHELNDKLRILNLESSNIVSIAKAELGSNLIRLQTKEAECQDLTDKLIVSLKRVEDLERSFSAKSQEVFLDDEQISELRRKLSELASSCEFLESKLKAKESEASNFELNFNQIADENRGIMEMVEKIKVEKIKSDGLIKQLSNEKALLESNIATQTTELALLKQSYEDLSTSFKANFEQLVSAQKELSALHAEVRTLTSENKAFAAMKAENDAKIQERLEKQESEVSILKETITSSLQERVDAEALETNAKKLAEAQSLISKLQEDVIKFEMTVNGLSNENARINLLFESLQVEHRSLVESRENLWASLNTNMKELKLVRDEKLGLEDSYTRLQSDFQSLAEENEMLQQVKLNDAKRLDVLKVLEKEHHALKQSVDTLKNALESKSLQLQTATTENSAVVESNAKLVAEINLLVKERNETKESAHALKLETEGQERRLMEETQLLSGQLIALQSECLSLKVSLERTVLDLSQKEKDLEVISKEKLSLNDASSKLEYNLKLSMMEVEYTKKERDQLKADLEQLSVVSKTNKSIATEYSKFVALLDQKNSEYLELQKTLNDTSLELDRQRDIHAKVVLNNETSKALLSDSLKALELELLKVNGEKDMLIAENEQFMTLLTDHKVQNSKFQDSLQSLEYGKVAADAMLELSETNCQSLKDRLTTLTYQFEVSQLQVSQYAERIATSNEIINDLKTSIADLKIERAGLQDLLASLEISKTTSQAKIAELQFECVSLKDNLSFVTQQHERTLAELNKTVDDFLRLSETLRDLKIQLQQSNAEVINIQSERDQFKRELVKLGDLTTLNSVLEAANLNITHLLEETKYELKASNLRVQDLTNNSINRKEEETEPVLAYEQQVSDMRKEIEMLSQSVLALKGEKETLSTELGEKVLELESLNHQVLEQAEGAARSEKKLLADLARSIESLENGKEVAEFVHGNSVLNALVSRIVSTSFQGLQIQHSVIANEWSELKRELALLLKMDSFTPVKALEEIKKLLRRLEKADTDLKSQLSYGQHIQNESNALIANEREKNRSNEEKIRQQETTIDQLTSEWRIKCHQLESRISFLQLQLAQKIEESKSLEDQLVFEMSNRPQPKSRQSPSPVPSISKDTITKSVVALRSVGTQSESLELVDASTGMDILMSSRSIQTTELPVAEEKRPEFTREVSIDFISSDRHENAVVTNLVMELSQVQGQMKLLQDDLERVKLEKKELKDVILSRNQEAARIINDLDAERLFRDSAESETFSLRNKLLEMQQLKDSEIERRFDFDTISSLMLVFQEVVNTQYSLTDYMESKLVSTSSENRQLRLVQNKYDLLLKESEKLHAACDNWNQSYNELRLECNDSLDIKIGEINDLKSIILQRNDDIEDLRLSNIHLTEALDLVKESDELHKAKCNELKLIISESESSGKAKLQALEEQVAHWKIERDIADLKFSESEKRASQLSKEWDESFMQLRILANKEKESLIAEHKNIVAKLEERFENETNSTSSIAKELLKTREERDDLKTAMNESESLRLQLQKDLDDKILNLRKELDKEAMGLRLEKKKSDSLHTIIQADREKCARLENQREENHLRIQALTESITTMTATEQTLKKHIALLQSNLEASQNDIALLKRQLEFRAKRYTESEMYLRKQLTDSRDEYHQKEMQWVSDQSRLEQHNEALSENCEVSISEFHQLVKDKNELELRVRILTDTLALKTAEWSALEAELNDMLASERELAEEHNIHLARLQSDGENDQIEQIRLISRLEKENTVLQDKLNESSANEVQLKRQLVILETELRTSALEWDQDRKYLEDEISQIRMVTRQQIDGLQGSINISHQQFQQKESHWISVEKDLHARLLYESQELEQASAEVYRLNNLVNTLEYALADINTKRSSLESQLDHLEKMLAIDQQNLERLLQENSDLRFQLSASHDYIQTLEHHAAAVKSPRRVSELVDSVQAIRNNAEALMSRKNTVSIGTQTSKLSSVNRSSMTTSDLILSYAFSDVGIASKLGESNDSLVDSSKKQKSVSFADGAVGGIEQIEEEVEAETIIYYEESSKRGSNIARINREIEQIQAKHHQSKHKTKEAIENFFNLSPTLDEDKDIDFIKAATKRSVVGTGTTVQTVLGRKTL